MEKNINTNSLIGSIMKGEYIMFENSNMWIGAKASEEIKNNSICVYHSNDETLTNIKHRNEIATEVFVFVDADGEYINGDYIVPQVINKDMWVKCLRIHILA